VLSIALPPLRQRPEDIPQLCRHFRDRFNAKMGKRIEGLSPAAMKMLFAHNWPGNVRELENVIERAVLLADDVMLTPEHLPPEISARPPHDQTGDVLDGFSLKAAQRSVEKKLIARALEKTGGNRTHAARLLEISHPSLLSKIKMYEIG
jgi:two-component system response regulator AtoC